MRSIGEGIKIKGERNNLIVRVDDSSGGGGNLGREVERKIVDG